MATQQEQQFMVPLDTYLKAGLHIGTKFKTTYMSQFIYKVRPDGLSVLNIQAINKRIELACKFLSRYAPEDILVIGKRENGWKAMKMFSELTGIRSYRGRYHPGIMTNPQLEDFLEAKVILVTDPWPDKDSVQDAVVGGAAVVALCDTNNESNYLDLVVPCNNKGKKSLGLFFYILAREYMKARSMIKDEKEMKISIDEFMAE
jgi:small subunit ribosomal protein S2